MYKLLPKGSGKGYNRPKKGKGARKMLRVEDKYCCSEQELTLLQRRLEVVLRADSNQKSPLGYKVTSVYFDDFQDSKLGDNLAGVSHRNKYRIRIYNDSFDTIKLEVKYKAYNRVAKLSRNISWGEMESLIRGRCIPDPDPKGDSPVTLFNLAIRQEMLRPKVIVEYDRKAFVYPAGNVRITLDRNVRHSRDLEGFLRGNKRAYTPVPQTDRVLEVKYDSFLPDFVAGLLETGNLNQSSYSKYGMSRMTEV